jgi:hypothetical protein
MADLRGFWSYVHADDSAEGGRILRLAQDLRDQFEMLTGESIALFVDKDSLEWGTNWREAISLNLASVAFFVPVMTPRYFRSVECLRELDTFARQATKLGVKELILPLYYVDVPALNNQSPDDYYANLAGTFQWEDWREIRFLDVVSEGYRRGVARLARSLVEANRKAEEKTTAMALPAETPEKSITEDDSPGTIDQLALYEEALPKLGEILVSMTQDIELIGTLMRTASDDTKLGNAQGHGFSVRLAVARRLSSQLAEPTERIWLLSNEYVSQLHNVDDGFRLIVERAPVEIQENPESKANFCVFFESSRNLSTAAHTGFQSSQEMIDAIEPLEKMARDLRPVLRRLRQGLTILVESREVTDDWVRLIDATGIACEGTDP